MKKLLKTALLCFFTLSVMGVQAQKAEACPNPNLVKDTTKKSIKSFAEGKIGGATFTINYHSPGVRKRIIWGGLVPFDEVWVTGAHDATTLTVDKDVLLGGIKVAAGKYALFTIPGEKEWTVVINRHWKQHLASEYDQKDDVVRIRVKPQDNTHTERLQYFIEAGKDKKGTIAVAWEKVRISFPVSVL
ncbi:MAG TPA: DUF2911 domain-containing protein [Chitinophagaceae bacterium]